MFQNFDFDRHPQIPLQCFHDQFYLKPHTFSIQVHQHTFALERGTKNTNLQMMHPNSSFVYITMPQLVNHVLSVLSSTNHVKHVLGREKVYIYIFNNLRAIMKSKQDEFKSNIYIYISIIFCFLSYTIFVVLQIAIYQPYQRQNQQQPLQRKHLNQLQHLYQLQRINQIQQLLLHQYVCEKDNQF